MSELKELFFAGRALAEAAARRTGCVGAAGWTASLGVVHGPTSDGDGESRRVVLLKAGKLLVRMDVRSDQLCRG